METNFVLGSGLFCRGKQIHGNDVSLIQGCTKQRSSGRASCHKSYSNQMLIHHELLGTLKSENDVKIDVFSFNKSVLWVFGGDIVSEMIR